MIENAKLNLTGQKQPGFSFQMKMKWGINPTEGKIVEALQEAISILEENDVHVTEILCSERHNMAVAPWQIEDAAQHLGLKVTTLLD